MLMQARPHQVRHTGSVEQSDRDAANALLRRLLAAVEDGTLEAAGPGAGLVRQMQGAAEALDLTHPREQEK